MIVYPMYEVEVATGSTEDKYGWIVHVDGALLIHPHYAFSASMCGC